MAARYYQMTTQQALDCMAKKQIGALRGQTRCTGDYVQRVKTFKDWYNNMQALGCSPDVLSIMAELCSEVKACLDDNIVNL